MIGFISSSNASQITWSGRFTTATFPGRLKHPSSPVCSPSDSIISGLIIINGPCPSPISMTTIRFKIPTCGAASPTPIASYIVSYISSTNVCILGVISFTSLDVFLKMSSPNTRICRIAIIFSFSSC